MDELENIILSKVTKSEKEHTWYALTYKWILAQKFGIPNIQFTDCMKFKKKEEQSMGASFNLRSVNKILSGGHMERKCGAETEGIKHPEIDPPGNLSHIELPNQAIGDSEKCLLREA